MAESLLTIGKKAFIAYSKKRPGLFQYGFPDNRIEDNTASLSERETIARGILKSIEGLETVGARGRSQNRAALLEELIRSIQYSNKVQGDGAYGAYTYFRFFMNKVKPPQFTQALEQITFALISGLPPQRLINNNSPLRMMMNEMKRTSEGKISINQQSIHDKEQTITHHRFQMKKDIADIQKTEKRLRAYQRRGYQKVGSYLNYAPYKKKIAESRTRENGLISYAKSSFDSWVTTTRKEVDMLKEDVEQEREVLEIFQRISESFVLIPSLEMRRS